MLICLNKSKYDSLDIKTAFQSVLDTPPPIFNPLESDTKVAVITTPVRGSTITVIYNYNKGERSDPSDAGYQITSAATDQSIIVNIAYISV